MIILFAILFIIPLLIVLAAGVSIGKSKTRGSAWHRMLKKENRPAWFFYSIFFIPFLFLIHSTFSDFYLLLNGKKETGTITTVTKRFATSGDNPPLIITYYDIFISGYPYEIRQMKERKTGDTLTYIHAGNGKLHSAAIWDGKGYLSSIISTNAYRVFIIMSVLLMIMLAIVSAAAGLFYMGRPVFQQSAEGQSGIPRFTNRFFYLFNYLVFTLFLVILIKSVYNEFAFSWLGSLLVWLLIQLMMFSRVFETVFVFLSKVLTGQLDNKLAVLTKAVFNFFVFSGLLLMLLKTLFARDKSLVEVVRELANYFLG